MVSGTGTSLEGFISPYNTSTIIAGLPSDSRGRIQNHGLHIEVLSSCLLLDEPQNLRLIIFYSLHSQVSNRQQPCISQGRVKNVSTGIYKFFQFGFCLILDELQHIPQDLRLVILCFVHYQKLQLQSTASTSTYLIVADWVPYRLYHVFGGEKGLLVLNITQVSSILTNSSSIFSISLCSTLLVILMAKLTLTHLIPKYILDAHPFLSCKHNEFSILCITTSFYSNGVFFFL